MRPFSSRKPRRQPGDCQSRPSHTHGFADSKASCNSLRVCARITSDFGGSATGPDATSSIQRAKPVSEAQQYRLEQLDASKHGREDFKCESSELTGFLRKRARKEMQARSAVGSDPDWTTGERHRPLPATRQHLRHDLENGGPPIPTADDTSSNH